MVRLKVNNQEPLKAELMSFADAVCNDTAPLVSGEDGKKALQLAQALVKSGLEQVVINID